MKSGMPYALLVLNLLAGSRPALPQNELDKPPAPHLSLGEMEKFLRESAIVQHKSLSEGVTNSERATLAKGQFKHDAHIQTIDLAQSTFTTVRGTELNFKDTYKFNIAAYRLAKLMHLNMVPVSVERKAGGRSAAVTWWVDNTLMTELERHKRKLEPHDTDSWNRQMFCVRVFDQLIYNTDRNLGNLVIDQNWKIWMIDHTRAFRLMNALPNPKNLAKCDRNLLAELRNLNEANLTQELHPYLTKAEVKALLARRNLIVRFFEEEIARKGENSVLFDLPKDDALNREASR